MPISNLPPEILAEVFTYLQDADVFSGRLSSRYLERASFAHFGKRFFRKKGYMITTPSLSVLQNIAAHEELKKYPQHVWFNPDCYTFARPECAPEDEDSDLDSVDELETPYEKTPEVIAPVNRILEKQYAAYQQCVQDHAKLLWGGRLKFELTKAFGSLPNLQTVGMRRSEDYSPYGWSLLEQAIGEDPRVLGPIPSTPSSDLSGSTQLFIALLHSLAASSQKIQRLYTDAVEIDAISPYSLPQSILNTACSSILYIELNVIKAYLTRHPSKTPPSNPYFRTDYEPGSGLARLFSATPSLLELGLQIFRDRKQSHLVPPRPRDPSSWRESYPYLALSHTTSNTTFEFLTRIKLEKVTATSSMLISILSPCASKLTSIKMRDIRLLSSTSKTGVEPETRPWATVFAWLASSCLELEYILFYHLLHDSGGVSFTPQPPLANPDEVEEISFLIEHVPPSHGGEAVFSKYEHLNLEVSGREEVQRRLREVEEQHWYHLPLFSYAMDEELWHTDTSDEEW